MSRKIIWIAGLALIVLFMAWVRVYTFGHSARKTGDSLMAQNKVDEAVGYYDRALHMYWPGSPDVAQAVMQLTKIANHAKAAGDINGALHVWRVLRSGLYATRGLYQPYRNVIADAEKNIADLVAHKLDSKEEGERQLALMKQSTDPARTWSMLALLGFAMWVGSAISFIWRALTPDGKLLTQPAIVWGATFIAGYAVWLMGLALA